MGDSADTAREKIAARKKLEKKPVQGPPAPGKKTVPRSIPKKEKPWRPSDDAKAFGAATSIFVPPELQRQGKKPPKRSAVFTNKPRPETTAERKSRQKRETIARERLQLGLRISNDTGANRLDSVPEYRKPPSRRIPLLGGMLSVPRTIPGTDIALSAIGKGLVKELGPLLETPQGSIVTGKPMTAEEAEKNLETAVGKSLTNLVLHGDTPETWGQVAGLGVGVAGIAPVGRLGRGGAMGVIEAAKILRAGGTQEEARAAARIAQAAADAYKGPGVIAKGISKGKEKLATRAQMTSIQEHAGEIVQLRDEANAAAKKAQKALDESTDAAEQEILRNQIAGHKAFADNMTAALEYAKINPDNLHRVISKKRGQANLNQVINPKNQGIGGAGNKPVVSAMEGGGAHQIIGEIAPSEYTERLTHILESAPEVLSGDMTAAELGLQLAYWYRELGPMFRTFFGDDSAAILRGFAVSQANASPAGGLMNVLRVRDKLMRGEEILPDEISTVVKSIEAAYEGRHVSDGMAAKLHDFADSLEGKATRTWTNDDIRGGSPTAIDIHAQRDLGRVDPKILDTLRTRHGIPVAHLQLEVMGRELARLKAAKAGSREFKNEAEKRAAIVAQKKKIREFKASDAEAIAEGRASGIKLDNPQASATGNAYNYALREYAAITDHFNQIKFLGKEDWMPAEVQALGWSTIQRYHGVTPQNATSAIDFNTHVIPFETLAGMDGVAAPGYEQAMKATMAQERNVRRIVEEEGGIIREINYGPGGYDEAVTPSAQLHVIASPETADNIAQRLADEYGQFEVWATRPGVTGGKSRATIEITSEAFSDPKKVEAFWRALQRTSSAAQKKHLKGFSPYSFTEKGVKYHGIRIITGHAYVPLKNTDQVTGILVKYEKAINDAAVASGDDVSFGLNNVEVRKFNARSNDQAPVSSGSPGESAADNPAAQAGIERGPPEGLVDRLRSETGTLTIEAPDVRSLDEILATYNPRELTVGGKVQQMQSARSRLSGRVLERPADAFSRSLEPGGRLSSLGELPLFSNASATGRVMRHAGRELALESSRSRGAIRQYERLLPKRAESVEDVAHFWWAQLPAEYRNAEGLLLVRNKWQENYLALRDGSVMEGLQNDLADIHADMAEWAGDGPPYDLMHQSAVVRTAISDIPVLLKTMPEKITRLDAVIASNPQLDPEILRGVRGIASSREKTLLETGALDHETAINRNGLVSEWLGLEVSGEEIYMGHRIGKVRGANPGGLPAKYALGRPRSASGIGRENRLILVNNARARETTHIAVDDWLSSQTFRQGLTARQDLGSAGGVFDPATFDNATEVLVNPKSRSIPIAWKESGGNLLDEAVAAGYDEQMVRKAADDLVHSYQTIPGDEQSYARVLRQAQEDGVDYSELRVIKKAAADRYYSQIARPNPATKGGDIYDASVDFMVASLVFGRIGYVPKNFVANLLMAVPHQGVYFFANSPRSAQLITAGVRGDREMQHLTDMILGEVGQGATMTLKEEAASPLLRVGGKVRRAPAKVADVVSSAADAPARMSAFLHEAAAIGVIPKMNPVLQEADKAALLELFKNPKYRPILNDIRSRSVEAMADFSRMTPVQRKWTRRFLIVPGWLWAGTRYPIHFAASYPGRTAALGYIAAGEPGADRLGLPQNPNLFNIQGQVKQKWLRGIETPWGTIRTGSISPISTPIDLVNSAIQGEVVGDSLNPMIVALYSIAQSEINSPTGSFKAPFWESVIANIKRLVPNERLIEEMISPNKNSKYYPQDATRWGRFLRELGVVPIDITIPGEGGSTSRSGGSLMPTPGESSSGGSLTPTPGGSSSGDTLMPTP